VFQPSDHFCGLLWPRSNISCLSCAEGSRAGHRTPDGVSYSPARPQGPLTALGDEEGAYPKEDLPSCWDHGTGLSSMIIFLHRPLNDHKTASQEKLNPLPVCSQAEKPSNPTSEEAICSTKNVHNGSFHFIPAFCWSLKYGQ